MTAVGPLVVRGRRWMLPDGRRGELQAPTVAAHAALWGVPVVLVVGDPVDLYDEAAHTVEGIGDGPAGTWRYRVGVPGADPVTVCVLDRDRSADAGPWWDLTGTELAATLYHLGRLLGVPWEHSTGRTAERLILSTHPLRHGGTRLDRAPAVPEPARDPSWEQPWAAWGRSLSPEEAGAAWVHTYDLRAAYLGAWQTTDLGLGAVTHLPDAGACAPLVRRPGVWWVELGAGWDHRGLPPVAVGLRGKTRRGWVSTPTLTRLREWAQVNGWPEPEPSEGYAWARSSRFLRRSGELLRDARTAAGELDAQAHQLLATAGDDDAQADRGLLLVTVAERIELAVKDLYARTNGRLSSSESYVPAGFRRPDWAATLRAAFRTSLHRKLAALDGARPFAVATDAVAFATDEPDPVAFAAAVGLRLGSGIGQWKYTGTLPAAEVPPLAGAGAEAVGDLFDRAADPRVRISGQ